MYLTYQEYVAMGGTVEATVFTDLEYEAEALVNYYTFNRLVSDTVFPEPLKRLMKYLVDLGLKKANALTLGNNAQSVASPYITSQSNDGFSVTYSGMNSADLYKLCKSDAESAIKSHLQNVMNEAGRRLLYRGLYPGE